MKHHLALGESGEELAVKYLVESGYAIIEKNWRFKRAEIDIIIKKESCLIFCEVKTRSNTFYGSPESFVNKKKQELMVDAAVAYMNSRDYQAEFRFDIIAIVMKNPGEFSLKHYEDAFFPGFEGII